MQVFLFYLASLLATCVYLWVYGGRTGRWMVADQFVTAVLAAVLSYNAPSFVWLQPRMAMLDVASLLVKIAIAFLSNRRWPIWVAALQLNTVLAQVAIMISPDFRNAFYYAMATIWAMPTLLVMVLGLYFDRRHDQRLVKAS
jgi:hypothetical protein